MKNAPGYAAASAPAIVLALVLGTVLPAEASTSRCAEFSRQARTGDLLFRAEDSWISLAVMHAQRDWRFSHVGIAVETDQGTRVFHSEYDPASGTDGVVSHDVCTFARRAQRLELRRLDWIDEKQRRKIVEVIRAIGAPRFNLSFEASPADGSLYCTQYVWRVLGRAVPAGVEAAGFQGVITITTLLDLPGSRVVAASALDLQNRVSNWLPWKSRSIAR